MKEKVIGMMVTTLISFLTPDLLKKFADMVLDFVEEAILGTASEVDDKFVLPLIESIRNAFDLED